MLLPILATYVALTTLAATTAAVIKAPILLRPENETSFWLNEAEAFVQQQVSDPLNTGRARNAVVFIGAGMSMTTLAAARVYIGAEETQLAFEAFPGVGMLRTYCVDEQVADDACAATALFGGVKSNRGTVGVTAAVSRGECRVATTQPNEIVSIAQEAVAAGKWIGVVTNGRVTAATVSALYAHSANASWENDVLVRASGCDPLFVQDIAKQLVHGAVGGQLRVVLGGGRREFRDRSMPDEGGERGARGDGRDLIREWSANKYGSNASYVWNRAQFNEVDASETEYLLGLFGHADFTDNLEVEQEKLWDAQPSLDAMVAKAIQVLGRNEAGYLLVVVNAQIDAAHHRNWARVALDETAELNRAVSVAKQMTSERDTLLVVTADHSHTLTYSGYPIRHNDIFGIADYGTWVGDDMPIMTLSYAAGGGFRNHMRALGVRERIDPTTLDTSGRRFEFPATMPAEREMHGGDDVAVYASGPWAHLFGGSAEQSVLAHVVRFATCLGGESAAELNACNLDGVEL